MKNIESKQNEFLKSHFEVDVLDSSEYVAADLCKSRWSKNLWSDRHAWWNDTLVSPYMVDVLDNAAEAVENLDDTQEADQIKKQLEDEFGNNPILSIVDQSGVEHYYPTTEEPNDVFSDDGRQLKDLGFTL